MKNLFSYQLSINSYCLLLISYCILSIGFIADDYFSITQKDVAFKNPKGFPKPVYDLSKNKITPAGFLLGRKLFYDGILSKDNTISCASCHQRFAAFAHIDHQISHGINNLIGKRNVPALQNLVWNSSFMWDGGVNHLDLQPVAPITNSLEMAETLANVLKKLRQNKEYVLMFKQAYNDTVITTDKFLKSISQFLALMVSADSRYDRYTNGKDTLSKSEKNGLKLFRANCAACHKEPLFTDNSFRNNGLTINPAFNDSGRLMITGLKSDYLKFKVPSLRNVEVTYPYMHDGRFYSLKQVLNHYTKTNTEGEIRDPVLQKGIILNEQEKTDIISFLKTLTDKTFLHDRRFDNPFLASYIKKIEIKPVVLSEDELIVKYKTSWDSVQLKTSNRIPQYATYIDELDKITENIEKHCKQPKTKLPKLEKLQAQLQNSKKHKEAIANYFTYGQPNSITELTEACKQVLSIINKADIEITNTDIKKPSKTGWVVLVSYKIKGNTDVIKTSSFEINYNPATKTYTAVQKK
jgi:cytochrome c peroxidase